MFKNMTATGITITTKKKRGVTQIIVDSQKYNEETIYHDVTFETEYQNSIKKSFDNMFKGFKPEDLEEKLTIEKVA